MREEKVRRGAWGPWGPQRGQGLAGLGGVELEKQSKAPDGEKSKSAGGACGRAPVWDKWARAWVGPAGACVGRGWGVCGGVWAGHREEVVSRKPDSPVEAG